MTKHTKGPWRRQGAVIWGKEIQREIARVITQPGEPFQDNANARLIEAAPELLEACKYALEHLDPCNGDQECIDAVRKAVAKAEGEEK